MAGLGGKAFQHFGQDYIEQQRRVIEELTKRCEKLENDLEEEKKALYGAQVALSQEYQYMNERKEMNPLIEENLRGNNRQIKELDARLDMQEVKIKTAAKAKNIVVGTAEKDHSTVQTASASESEYSCVDYFDFENHFRGPRENIKELQKQYLKYFIGKSNVLDLGCGRG